ncbi:VOC family protein [Gordonia rhizosphera]|uniref:VOC domain-containing protein n=1 Tax=Gordonia rhizosphera NBRC 16068 TaxID=1108045 RepID=K6WB32_9ACTN|nr:VOC family protein [Gordonia rhizosphera]GAB90971.1 hypothetical protein GORHZ_120_00270 [Gordonia rhizosphera NBRC 16068]
MSRLGPRGALLDLACGDPDLTHIAYGRLLDVPPAARIDVSNGAVRAHPGTVDHRVYFGVDDPDAARRLLGRRGLAPEEPVGVVRAAEPMATSATDITGIDHLVFTAPGRDHALALFGATLDLDFRLEREVADDARQLFFRATDLVVEVIAGAGPSPGEPNRCALWGVAWRSADVQATHRRLSALGVGTSEIRVGRKPGTRVFTVHDEALATRTLVIEAAPRAI